MTFKELKEECIKAVGYDPKLSGENMGNLSFYLSRINGCIQRAFDRIIAVGGLEESCILLEEVETSGMVQYDISKLLKGGTFKCFKSLKGGYSSLLPYAKVNNQCFLYRTKGDCAYLVYYEDIGDPSNDSDEINLPDRYIRIIPYYVKGELIEDEEPLLSASSKNTFEGLLSELSTQSECTFNKVKSIYEVEE